MIRPLPSLAGSKRVLLAAGAVACFAAAIVLEPTDVRSQLNAARPDAIIEPAPRVETPEAAIAPQGDAFAPRAEVESDRPSGVSVPLAAALPRLPGSPQTPSTAAAGTRVTAIATGTLPTAIVESGGSAHAVTAGDPLDGSRITAIDGRSITLANGRRLSLQPAAPAL
jgi:hypothetical protein